MKKERLDILLVKRGFFSSREKARSSIMAGAVLVDGNREDKPGAKVAEDADIVIKENINPYVSRGGLKLEKALKEFNIRLDGKTAIDVGASTGGFTDCMLKNGAKKVFAIDVGYGQLAWELRNDERVVCMERTNIRYVKPEDIGVAADFATVDVSFISLKKVLPVLMDLLNEDGEVVCLIKPQFEAGREKVGKHGVVRDKEVHREVIEDIIGFARETGFSVKALSYSPIKGPEGNIEYFTYLSKKPGNASFNITEDFIASVVEESHRELDK
ncbi:MAG TPA: TlyA family RNA methyltransferase [Clostridiaceae bacterium]|nr:TlyA family RNA methyltransferase [Clostridiaceae bacterium]